MFSRRITSCLLLLTLLATMFACRLPVYASIVCETEAKEFVEEAAGHDKHFSAAGHVDAAFIQSDFFRPANSWHAISNGLVAKRLIGCVAHAPIRGPPSLD